MNKRDTGANPVSHPNPTERRTLIFLDTKRLDFIASGDYTFKQVRFIFTPEDRFYWIVKENKTNSFVLFRANTLREVVDLIMKEKKGD